MQLNVLDNIQIATPCSASWDEMAGDDRVRYCSHCELNVYNLSDMRRDEAERLLLETEGRLCVRLFRRKDGTVLTRDCPLGLAAVRYRVASWLAAAAAAIGITISVPGCIMGATVYTGRPKFQENAHPPTSQPAANPHENRANH